MMNAPTDPKYYGGKTDKYEWTQTETEVDVYVYCKEGESWVLPLSPPPPFITVASRLICVD